MPSKRLIAFIEATLAVLAWGASFVATKVALRDASPVTVVWLRFGIGVIILGLATVLRKQFAIPDRKDWAYFALLGFLGITFHQWLQSTALQTSQATTSAWIVATTPIFMAIVGWLVLKESLNRWQVIGIMSATLGVLLVVTDGNLASLLKGNLGAPGNILVLISSVNWAVFSALSRRGLRQNPATRMMFYVMTMGWLFSTILFWFGSGPGQIEKLSISGWLGVVFLGVFCSGLAYIFWYDALQILPTAQAGAFVYLEPFVTVVLAALILDEQLLPAALLGGGAILLGVWMVTNRGR